MDYDKIYDVAFKLAHEAGTVISAAFKKKKNVETKASPKDLVTETDTAVEKLLIDSLKKQYPDHRFIGEESTAAGEKAEFTDAPTWIIDPIDGTMNFVHTFPQTCVSIGFWVDKQPQIGIVYNPILNQMFTARRGQGAYLNGEKINVSGQTDLSKSLVILEIGTRTDAEKMKIIFNNIHKILPLVHGMRSIGSAALDMCHVASGGAEAYYEIGIHAWDMAAGALIVTEAGGVAINVNGGPFDLLGRRVLCASSKEIADKLVDLLEIYEEERD